MSSRSVYNYLQDYVVTLQSKGIYSFSKKELVNTFNISDEALAMSINRLVKKKRIAIVRKEFYVIIPPEYLERGILPPILFVDDLMKFLNRDYYVSLLSAALYHGGTHQQPQEFYVSTLYPHMKNIRANGIVINFVPKQKLIQSGIEKQKTDTGFMNISCPELTAVDLVQHCNKIGGLERAATLLDEMAENINPSKLKSIAEEAGNVSSLQRLGYIFDKVLHVQKLSEVIKKVVSGKKTTNILLSSKHPVNKDEIDPYWKVIINTKIDCEL
ncbi:MAG: type IV toxin-antitoxin system AbiEi family antitoxin [Bacteroidota bacterium]